MTRRLAVVGGGIAGLAAAWQLRASAPDAAVTVHEPGHLGGKLRTSTFAGRPVDEGADAFLARVPDGRDLCAELGLADRLVSPATGTAFIARGRRLEPMPEGHVLGVPLAGPERVPDRPLAPGEDISIGELVRTRFGDDVLERLVDPLLGGINAGDCDRLSLRAAAPQLAEAAERSASLVEALRDRPPAPPGPVFWALPGGMASLVDALVGALGRDDGVAFAAEAVDDLAAVLADTGRDGVVLAAPAPAAARLLGGVGASEAASLLAELGHASPVLLTLAFRRADVRDPLAGSGLLVPRVEGRLLTACSFASTKWAHLAGDGGTVVLRASAGRYGDDRAIGMDDDVLLAAVLRDLDELLGLLGDPVEVRITRWQRGFPQYEPGHLDRVARMERSVADAVGPAPGGGGARVALAGAAYRGIGIPACIRQGRAAARQLAG